MKNRNVGLVILYSFLTLGIYTLFWLHSTRREMVNRGAKDIPSIWLLVIPALLLVTLLLVFFFSMAVSSLGGYESTTLLYFTLLFLAAPVVAMAAFAIGLYWFYKYCQAVEIVTNGKLSFALSYGLWVAFAITGFLFVWPGIIQDGFNKVAGMPVPPGPVPPAPAPASQAQPQSPIHDHDA